mgnify:CR=1 FL=1
MSEPLFDRLVNYISKELDSGKSKDEIIKAVTEGEALFEDHGETEKTCEPEKDGGIR